MLAEDEAGVGAWFEALAAHVRAVDFADARRLFLPDVIGFGTFTDFVDGLAAIEAAQWCRVWPHIDGFTWRPGIRAIVSGDRLQAVGMGVWDFDRIPRGRLALCPARPGDGGAGARRDGFALARRAHAFLAVPRRAHALVQGQAGRRPVLSVQRQRSSARSSRPTTQESVSPSAESITMPPSRLSRS